MDFILKWFKYGWINKNKLRGTLIIIFLFMSIFQILAEGFKDRFDFQHLWLTLTFLLLTPEIFKWFKKLRQRYKEI